MIMYTGMKYFLDKIGTNTSSVSGAFSFYRNSNDYLGLTTGANSNFKNLIFYKAGTLNGYDLFYDRTSTYALWFSDIFQYYTFSKISDVNKDYYDSNVSTYINVFSSNTPSGTYLSETWWGPPFSGGDSVFIPQINNTIVHPDQWATSSSFGILNTGVNGSVTGSFFQYSGTGFFNGSAIMKLTDPYTFDNDTILLSYEKLRTGDEILLSSVTGDSFSTYSGFCVGINNANKLYFKYWNPIEGIFSFTYSHMLANKNLLLLNRNNNILTMGHLNNNTQDFDVETFFIKNNEFKQGKELFIGGMYNNVPWANYESNNFSGYVDKFFIFKDNLIIYKSYYASGIFTLNTGSIGYFENKCVNTGYFLNSGFSITGVETGFQTNFFSITGFGVTGYVTGLNSYSYTGVTGYVNQSVGFFNDNCGNEIEIFSQIPLSGLITTNSIFIQELTGLFITTGFTQVPLTGNITGSVPIFISGNSCGQFFIPTGEELFIKDTDYLKSLSFSQVSLVSEINKNSDIVECYNENYQDKRLDYNNDLIFNYLDGSFFTNRFVNDENNLISGLLLFLNGQLILDSGFFLRTSGYDTFIVPNIDYYRTGNEVYVNETIDFNNKIFYDFISGDQETIQITGFSSGSQLIGKNFNNKFIFVNGQKLVSGITYTGINTINITIPSGENFIFIKSIPFFNYISGNMSTLSINRNLNKNSSQVYLNGIKQKLNSNYIENSNFDLISGDFNENQNNFIIYNNTDDFFV